MPTELPTGSPASTSVTTEITAAIHRFYACLNAGTPVEIARLLSSRFLTQPGTLFSVEDMHSATPLATEARIGVVSISDVQVLANERVAAFVVTARGDAETDGAKRTEMLIFVEGDKGWLLDEIINEIDQDGTRIAVADLVTLPATASPQP